MTEALPFASVIVPTIGRQALGRCIASLAAQDYPASRFEVIVVDDGSPQPGVSAAALARPGLHLSVLRQERAGPAAARNLGVARARGSCVAMIDDDCLAEPGWLRALVTRLASAEGAGAGGVVRNALAANPFAEASQLLVSYVCAYYNGRPGAAAFFTSNNLAFDRRALIESGAFNAQYHRAAAEDRELCDRWRAAGRPLLAAPDAVVWHAHDLDLAGFWRQHVAYGRGAWQFRRARAARRGGRVRVEPLSFYAGLLAAPFKARGPAGLTHAALLLLAQAANVVGFTREAIGGRSDAEPGAAPAVGAE